MKNQINTHAENIHQVISGSRSVRNGIKRKMKYRMFVVQIGIGRKKTNE